ncbi:MAG: hypothetical protein RL708_657 [Bacteroidota bacterium]|jgi:hypothetical protein
MSLRDKFFRVLFFVLLVPSLLIGIYILFVDFAEMGNVNSLKAMSILLQTTDMSSNEATIFLYIEIGLLFISMLLACFFAYENKFLNANIFLILIWVVIFLFMLYESSRVSQA